ncbi:MAG: hypothetical protein KDC98_15140, partial [Planctomycetes bacterium]|nr:hypothetical protein [Planctomycetota bacterium]
YSPSASAGGSGGGLWTPGQDGQVLFNNHIDPITNTTPRRDVMGPTAVGGMAMQFFPFPPASGSTRSSLHFLAGGSGGGGAASNCAFAIGLNGAPLLSTPWAAGAGAGGGGGALSLRTGELLLLGAAGSILANGGSAGSVLAPFGAVANPAPAGGGSGGTVLLQSGHLASLPGLIDVRGGTGGSYDRQTTVPPPAGAHVQIAGGNGGDGFVRLELPGAPTTALLPGMQPPPTAPNVARLNETDALVSTQSLFYETHLNPGPGYLRYEIEATVDGVAMVFSDDPGISSLTATVGAPLQAWFQAAELDPVTHRPSELAPWRAAVRSMPGTTGMDADRLGAFRFRLVQDRTLATTVEVTRVSVVYQSGS